MADSFSFFDRSLSEQLERILLELERQTLELKSLASQAGVNLADDIDEAFIGDGAFESLQARFEEAVDDAAMSVLSLSAMPKGIYS